MGIYATKRVWLLASFVYLFSRGMYAHLLPDAIYVINYTDSFIYQVDPISGGHTQITPISAGNPPGSAGINGIAIGKNRTSGYTVGFNDGFVYSFNLSTGTFSQVSNTSLAGLSNI